MLAPNSYKDVYLLIECMIDRQMLPVVYLNVHNNEDLNSMETVARKAQISYYIRTFWRYLKTF